MSKTQGSNLDREDDVGDAMLIGAGIAGLLIIALFFEMLSSSPKPAKKVASRANQLK